MIKIIISTLVVGFGMSFLQLIPDKDTYEGERTGSCAIGIVFTVGITVIELVIWGIIKIL